MITFFGTTLAIFAFSCLWMKIAGDYKKL